MRIDTRIPVRRVTRDWPPPSLYLVQAEKRRSTEVKRNPDSLGTSASPTCGNAKALPFVLTRPSQKPARGAEPRGCVEGNVRAMVTEAMEHP